MLAMSPFRHGPSWWVRFRDHRGAERKLRAGKSRRSADALSRRLVELVDHASVGSPIPPALMNWVMAQDAKRLGKLKEWRLVGERQLVVMSALGDVLNQWERAMLARGRKAKYAAMQAGRVTRLCKEAEFRTAADIEIERVLAVLDRWRRGGRIPGSERMRSDVSESTLAHYLRATKAFSKWVSMPPRGSGSDPLAGLRVESRATKPDRVKSNQALRRALSDDEQVRLVDAARRDPFRGRRLDSMTGEDWAMVYRVALGTGLRLGAIRRLVSKNVDAEGYLHARGSGAANKRTRVKPLGVGLLADLVDYSKGIAPDDLLFPRLLSKTHVAKQVRKHAASAGIDTRGVDFHCLRHTFGTSLARRGVHPKTLMELMDHSSIQLTMQLYVHSMPEDERTAVSGLPDLGGAQPDTNRATG